MEFTKAEVMQRYEWLYARAVESLCEELYHLDHELTMAHEWVDRNRDLAWDFVNRASLFSVHFTERLTSYEEGLWSLCVLMGAPFDSDKLERDVLSAFLFEYYDLVA